MLDGGESLLTPGQSRKPMVDDCGSGLPPRLPLASKEVALPVPRPVSELTGNPETQAHPRGPILTLCTECSYSLHRVPTVISSLTPFFCVPEVGVDSTPGTMACFPPQSCFSALLIASCTLGHHLPSFCSFLLSVISRPGPILLLQTEGLRVVLFSVSLEK